jgi:peptidoglycan/LPS O-acetylase OafA/YrhL
LLFLYSGWQSRHLEGLMEVQISPWAFVFLVQNFSIASIGHWAGPGWLAVTWSLAVEEQFYLILPALIRYLPPARLPPLCIAAVIAAPITRFAFLWLNPENTVAPLVLFPCRMDALFLGVLCALAYRDESIMRFLRNQRTAMSVAFIAALAAILAGSHHLNPNTFFTQVAGFSLIAVFYSLGLLIAVTAGAPSSWLRIGRTPLVWAGIGAYSMYLFHRPIQGLIEGYLGYESLVGRLASLLAVFVFALICWRLIERPAITFGRRLQYRGKRAAPLRQSALRPPSTARGGVAAEES